MKKILITGGTGFAASHLVEALSQKGEKDIHLTSYKDEGQFVKQFVPAENIHQINLADYQATQNLLKDIQPDQIYHLASLANVGDSFEKRKFILEMNTALQLNLLEAMRDQAPLCRMLYISTALVYAPSNQAINEDFTLGPDNPYALSKLIQDMMAYSFTRSEKLDIVRARPFNHIGERQTLGFVVADLAAAVAKVEKGELDSVKVGNLSSVRDFSDVKDMVNAYILLMEKGQSGEVYNIGSGQGVTVQQILDLLISIAKKEVKVEIDPQKIRPVDLPYLVCDNEKIVNLGYQAQYQLSNTLERILNYWRENI